MSLGVPSPNPENDPVLVEVQSNLIRRKEPVIGRVHKNEICMAGKSSSFVRHIEVDVSGTALAGTFTAGQAFGIIPPGENERGRAHNVRLYSLACPSGGEDGAGNIVSSTVKRLIDERWPGSDGEEEHSLFTGICSNYLCDLPVGSEVKVTGPSGKTFLLPQDLSKHDYLFIAAGTGIAPFRGMLKELLEAPGGPCASKIHVVMGSPYRGDLLYDDWFTSMAEQHEGFEYHTAISREPLPGASRGEYVAGLMERKIDTFAPFLASPRTLIYVCGLEGMQIGLYRMMGRHNLIGHYVQLPEEFDGMTPDEWPADRMKRRCRPTKRAMVEVY